jgi:hypothetical protein
MIFIEGPRDFSPFRLGSGWPGPAPSPGSLLPGGFLSVAWGRPHANRRRAEALGVLGTPRLGRSPRPECYWVWDAARVWGAAAPEWLASVRLSTPLRSPCVALSFLDAPGCGPPGLGSVGGARILGSGLNLMRATLRAVRGLPAASDTAWQSGQTAHLRVPPGAALVIVCTCPRFVGLWVVGTHDPSDEPLRPRKYAAEPARLSPVAVSWLPVRSVRRRPGCRVPAPSRLR